MTEAAIWAIFGLLVVGFLCRQFYVLGRWHGIAEAYRDVRRVYGQSTPSRQGDRQDKQSSRQANQAED